MKGLASSHIFGFSIDLRDRPFAAIAMPGIALTGQICEPETCSYEMRNDGRFGPGF